MSVSTNAEHLGEFRVTLYNLQNNHNQDIRAVDSPLPAAVSPQGGQWSVSRPLSLVP